MVASAACWGLATVMSKGALTYLPPVTLLAIQLSTSVAFLWAARMIAHSPLPKGREAGSAALTGLLEPGLAYTAGLCGLMLTGASHASLIGATEPLLIVLIAWVAFRHPPHRGTLIALAAAIPGMALVSGAGRAGGSESSLAGDGLVLLGTLFAALYVIRSSQLALRVAPLSLAAVQQTAGLVLVLALLAVALGARFEKPEFASVPAAIWLLILASGIVQYAFAFWFYLLGVRVLPVDKAALFLTLIPVFGASGAVVFLGETLTALEIGGATLVIGAIVATVRTSSLERHDGAPDSTTSGEVAKPEVAGARCQAHRE